MNIDEIQVESKIKRGCGYRKLGGLYLVSDGPAEPCGLLPKELKVCPCCGEGVKESRGFSWVTGRLLTSPGEVGCNLCMTVIGPARWHKRTCKILDLTTNPDERLGLIWVGSRFYKTPADFNDEARMLGISRRITMVPRGLILGETWIGLAHRQACPCWTCRGSGSTPGLPDFEGDKEAITHTVCDECKGTGRLPGLFTLFLPTRIEQLISKEQVDEEGFLGRLYKRGITPVLCDESDPDHNGKENTDAKG